MSWRLVARQDAKHLFGTRAIKGILAVLVASVLLMAYIYPISGEGPITTARFPAYVTDLLTTLVPLFGILLGYNAIVTERASGAIKLRLSLPTSRGDVVLGKFVGRAGLLTAAILVAMAGSAFLVWYPEGDFVALPFVGFVALTVLYALVWTGFGVAASMAVATKQRALVLGFGIFFLFTVAWDAFEPALQVGLNTAGLIDEELPALLQFAFDLEPGQAYTRVIERSIDPRGTGEALWYRSAWASVAVLVAWAVGPLGLAYRRFAGRDLS